MTLMCEGRRRWRALAGAVAASIRELTKLRGGWPSPTGALANDGKVIDDVRTYE